MTAKKANMILGCTEEGIVFLAKEMIVPLPS